jgi:hypothetical protein
MGLMLALGIFAWVAISTSAPTSTSAEPNCPDTVAVAVVCEPTKEPTTMVITPPDTGDAGIH